MYEFMTYRKAPMLVSPIISVLVMLPAYIFVGSPVLG